MTNLPRIINLGSGSRGNTTLLCHHNTILMIDCGFSNRMTQQRMTALGLDPMTVCGILLTHEHGDHIKGAPICSRQMQAPILATQGTIRGAGLSALTTKSLRCGQKITHEKFDITPVDISHDTQEPCAFLIEVDGVRSLFATDIGTTQGLDISELVNLDFLYIEANHDEEMLRNGPYPAFLKTRIESDGGHLNNRQSGELVRRLAQQSPNLRAIMLAHLSDQNNDREKALATVQQFAGNLPSVQWQVARQNDSVEMVPLTGHL